MSEFVNIIYISGIPGLLKKMRCKLIIDDDFIKVSRLGKIKANIKIKNIIQAEAKKDTDFTPSKEKDKSVIGRAIGGGLLLGPLGAVVGGMSGVGKKTKKQAATSNNWFVLIAFSLDGVQNIAVFKVEALIFKERVANKIVNEIITKRQLILSKAKNGNKEETIKVDDFRLKDKLTKLKSFYESGLINENEYSEKKKELLSKL